MNTVEFIDKAKKIHNNKYDYSKVEYINSKTKVCVVCSKHGEFYQKPYNHLNGQGCGKCRYENLSRNYRKTTEEWIKKAKEAHKDKYDYSKVEYSTCQSKVCIICPKHGEFWQRPLSHIQGQGCPHCYNEWKIGVYRLGNEKFIEKAKNVHGDKYDYSKVEYIITRKEVKIICPKHGEFLQTPEHHLQGKGCPKCNKSKLETEISLLLKENNIEFEEQKKFEWLKNYELDFYLPKYKLAIECQGIQHFKPIEVFGGENQLILQKEWDSEKKKLCNKNNVKILYFSNEITKKQLNEDFPYKVILDKGELINEIKELN